MHLFGLCRRTSESGILSGDGKRRRLRVPAISKSSCLRRYDTPIAPERASSIANVRNRACVYVVLSHSAIAILPQLQGPPRTCRSVRSSTAVRGRRRPRTPNRSRRTRKNETSCRELSKEERNITSFRSIALGPDFRASRGSFPLGAASRHRRRPVPLPPWDIPACKRQTQDES